MACAVEETGTRRTDRHCEEKGSDSRGQFGGSGTKDGDQEEKE